MNRKSKSNSSLGSPRQKGTVSRKSPRLLISCLNNNENGAGGDKSMNGQTGLQLHKHPTISLTTATIDAQSTTESISENYEDLISQKVSARRRISFDNKSSPIKICDNGPYEEDEEPEVPRRKKLRSEVTEDELWEGFPQNVRFKRLTPQKSPFVRCSLQNEGKSHETHSEDWGALKLELKPKSEDSITESELQLQDPSRSLVCSRTVVNIFTDFPKVVNEGCSTSGNFSPVKREKGNTGNNSSVTTPKRSARLQEKRESPSIRKNIDFVYTPLKRDDSKNRISDSKSDGMQVNVLLKDTQHCYVQEEKKMSENEKLKLLYKDIILRHQTPPKKEKCKSASTILSDLLEDIDNEECKHLTKMIGQKEEKNVQILKPDNTIHIKTKRSENIKTKHFKFKLKEASGIENEFSNMKIQSTAQNNEINKSEPEQKPGIKIRIKKMGNGTAVIQSGSKADHAYVQSKPKNESCRKVSSSSDKISFPKRRRYIPSVDDEDSLVKRRSPRVANASSVGKGPGMRDTKTTVAEQSDSGINYVSQNSRSSRQDRTMKRKSYSEEEQLLKNPRIEKFACMLWSSEQRRHFQQLNSTLSNQDLDNLMRKAWSELDSKDKLRYFNRASNATRDENKHSLSVRQFLDMKFPSDEAECVPCPAMGKFLSLSSSEQDEELKRWLKYFYEVSPSEYKKLTTLEIPKLRKGEIKSADGLDQVKYYRKFLYQSILDSKDKIYKIYERKKKKQQEFVKEAFGTIVKRLINGKSTEDLKFSRDVVSKQLAEVLLDLQYLENERKVGVCGAPLATRSFEDVLHDLTNEEEESSKSNAPGNGNFDDICGLGEDDENDENQFSQELLDQVHESELPLLEVESLSDVLDCSTQVSEGDELTFSNEIFEQLSSIFEQQAKKEIIIDEKEPENSEVRNPANILTSWVLADQFKAMSRGYHPRNFHSLYSLVARKHLLPFLPSSEPTQTVTSCPSNNPSDVNNSSVLRDSREHYQANLNGIYHKSGLVSSQTAPVVRMVASNAGPVLQVPQIRPAIRMLTPHRLVRRVPIGHTLVKFTSEQEGRCRVFSVRQAR